VARLATLPRAGGPDRHHDGQPGPGRGRRSSTRTVPKIPASARVASGTKTGRSGLAWREASIWESARECAAAGADILISGSRAFSSPAKCGGPVHKMRQSGQSRGAGPRAD
jgi:hypothetical protein